MVDAVLTPELTPAPSLGGDPTSEEIGQFQLQVGKTWPPSLGLQFVPAAAALFAQQFQHNTKVTETERKK